MKSKIENIDALRGLPQIADKSVQLIIADPPYFLGLTSNGKKGSYMDLNIARPFFEQILGEFKRVLTDNGSLFWFCDFRSYAFYYPIIEAGFGVTNLIVWDKGAGPGNKYGFNHEFVIFCSKDKKLNKGGSNVWQVPGFTNPKQRALERQIFDSQKPKNLIEKLIAEHTNSGDTVLDPFMGSGTTAVVCRQMKRKCIGYEINPKNFSMIKNRLNAPIMFSGLGKTEVSWTDDLRSITTKWESVFAEKKQVPRNEIQTPARTVHEVRLSDINVDLARFQNRTTDYSEQSVQNIINNFDPNRLDPIKLWKDTKGKTWLLSGHSRLEAFRRMNKKTIPATYFTGTEAEAVLYAKTYSNRSGTAEGLVSDIQAFRLMRDGSSHTKPVGKEELKRFWGSRANKLDAWTYLAPKGKFIEYLSTDAKNSFPYIENRAMNVGFWRKHYPQLTNSHENEIFDYWYGKGSNLVTEEMQKKVERIAGRLDFDPDKPLHLERGSTGLDARADTAGAQKRLYEIEDELKELRSKIHNALTKDEKAALVKEVEKLMQERQRIEEQIKIVVRTQTALFGLRDEGYYGIDELTENEVLNLAGIVEEGSGLGAATEQDVYDIINDKLLKTMQNVSQKEYVKPWDAPPVSFAYNLQSKRNYRGINFFICLITGLERGWDVLAFLTVNQVKEYGGSIKKGAKSVPIVYYATKYKKGGKYISEAEVAKMNVSQKAGLETFRVLRYYSVFHVYDCENLKIELPKPVKTPDHVVLETCEDIVSLMPKRPKIQHNGGDEAFYSLTSDSVHLPPAGYFHIPQMYYSVLFHELIHATGHSSRLDRLKPGAKFGNEMYAQEEMVAEIGGAYLCAFGGILNYTIKNSAAYVDNWRSVLVKNGKGDKKFIFEAAAQGQKAADYILGVDVPDNTTTATKTDKPPKPLIIIKNEEMKITKENYLTEYPKVMDVPGFEQFHKTLTTATLNFTDWEHPKKVLGEKEYKEWVKDLDRVFAAMEQHIAQRKPKQPNQNPKAKAALALIKIKAAAALANID